jgi:hypothetical protein
MHDDGGTRRSLDEVRALVEQLSAQIGATADLGPTYGASDHNGRPHIEVDPRHYHFVVCERGEEYERGTTASLDEVLFWIFETITFQMACRFEGTHRKPGQDPRRIMFANQLGLLATLDETWAKRESQTLTETLAKHPFTSGTLGD